ncbi:universal stress protein [Leeuwenhoekiella sp. MAR_2009_132]|uniref:universal stress protein n=1 Tax=Leeuwenhoekiella sp. MAR_2009_132 TaxID=1392489 RepID=UPI00048C201A|nr:universal stress protein [Leeuwenhoekiella sp. MAR_2009_132]
MKRILLPTDFSENSLNAIHYALSLMKNVVCEFFLLYTYTPPMISTRTILDSSSVWDIQKIAENNAIEELNRFKIKIENEFINEKHTFTSIVSFNLLIPEMCDIAEKESINLVIMGTQGATGAKMIFLGTNTMYAIKRLKIPVLAVPSGYVYEDPKEILFPTDYYVERKNNYLGLIREICKMHQSRLHILNSYFGVELSTDQAALKTFLDTFFKNSAHLFHIADGKDVLEAIDESELQSKIHLLVMIHNKHNFFENLLFKPVINQIVYKTNVPFLVIPSLERQ